MKEQKFKQFETVAVKNEMMEGYAIFISRIDEEYSLVIFISRDEVKHKNFTVNEDNLTIVTNDSINTIDDDTYFTMDIITEYILKQGIKETLGLDDSNEFTKQVDMEIKILLNNYDALITWYKMSKRICPTVEETMVFFDKLNGLGLNAMDVLNFYLEHNKMKDDSEPVNEINVDSPEQMNLDLGDNVIIPEEPSPKKRGRKKKVLDIDEKQFVDDYTKMTNDQLVEKYGVKTHDILRIVKKVVERDGLNYDDLKERHKMISFNKTKVTKNVTVEPIDTIGLKDDEAIKQFIEDYTSLSDDEFSNRYNLTDPVKYVKSACKILGMPEDMVFNAKREETELNKKMSEDSSDATKKEDTALIIEEVKAPEKKKPVSKKTKEPVQTISLGEKITNDIDEAPIDFSRIVDKRYAIQKREKDDFPILINKKEKLVFLKYLTEFNHSEMSYMYGLNFQELGWVRDDVCYEFNYPISGYPIRLE